MENVNPHPTKENLVLDSKCVMWDNTLSDKLTWATKNTKNVTKQCGDIQARNKQDIIDVTNRR